MIIKCTNLIEEEEDKNSDDDNQDSKKTMRENFSKHVFSRLIYSFFVCLSQKTTAYLKSDFVFILANEMIMKNEQINHQPR